MTARARIAFASLAVGLLVAPAAHACAVCWGNPDDPLVKGANSGIWVLLAIVAFVQAGFVALFWSFWRRARDQRRFRESLRVLHPFDRVDAPLTTAARPSSFHPGGPQS